MAAYGGLLFYLSSLHQVALPRFTFSDKVAHLGFYAGFGLVFTWACDASARGWSALKTFLVAGSFALLYGLTDEFHQHFVLGRIPDLVDLAFDAFGGCLGGGLYLALQSIRRSRRKGKTEADDPAVVSF